MYLYRSRWNHTAPFICYEQPHQPPTKSSNPITLCGKNVFAAHWSISFDRPSLLLYWGIWSCTVAGWCSSSGSKRSVLWSKGSSHIHGCTMWRCIAPKSPIACPPLPLHPGNNNHWCQKICMCKATRIYTGGWFDMKTFWAAGNGRTLWLQRM